MKPLFSSTAKNVARIVFENIRTTVVCASVAVAGLAVSRFKELSFLGASLAPWISIAIVICASLLVMWNILIGFSQFHEELPAKNAFAFGGLYLPVLFIYFVAATTVFGGIAKLQMNSLKASSSAASLSKTGSPASPVEKACAQSSTAIKPSSTVPPVANH